MSQRRVRAKRAPTEQEAAQDPRAENPEGLRGRGREKGPTGRHNDDRSRSPRATARAAITRASAELTEALAEHGMFHQRCWTCAAASRDLACDACVAVLRQADDDEDRWTYKANAHLAIMSACAGGAGNDDRSATKKTK